MVSDRRGLGEQDGPKGRWFHVNARSSGVRAPRDVGGLDLFVHGHRTFSRTPEDAFFVLGGWRHCGYTELGRNRWLQQFNRKAPVLAHD
jgi:hypothetical protein